MNTLQLPKMSTDKPKHHSIPTDDAKCTNYLCQHFTQKAPNLVWVSDFTYLKVAGKWYYLCIIMDLFSRKIISWHISGKADVDLVRTTFLKAYKKQNAPYGLMFHSDRAFNILLFAFVIYWIPLMLYNPFQKKGIHLTMLYVNVFSNISKKKKPIEGLIIHYKSYKILSLNTLKDFTTLKDHTNHLDFLLQMRLNIYTGNNTKLLFLEIFFHKNVSTILTIVQHLKLKTE